MTYWSMPGGEWRSPTTRRSRETSACPFVVRRTPDRRRIHSPAKCRSRRSRGPRVSFRPFRHSSEYRQSNNRRKPPDASAGCGSLVADCTPVAWRATVAYGAMAPRAIETKSWFVPIMKENVPMEVIARKASSHLCELRGATVDFRIGRASTRHPAGCVGCRCVDLARPAVVMNGFCSAVQDPMATLNSVMNRSGRLIGGGAR